VLCKDSTDRKWTDGRKRADKRGVGDKMEVNNEKENNLGSTEQSGAASRVKQLETRVEDKRFKFS
jgi:hypothetical protein